MKQEFKFKDFLKKYLIWILIVPIIAMSALSLIIEWGSAIINTKEIIIDFSSPIKVGEYLYYYFTIVGIEVSGLLSYTLLKTSLESNRLSQEINDKEQNRDREKIRESALIVYYDILSKISNLRLLYTNEIFESKREVINKFNITSDWVKNIANLRDVLTEDELETIFDLYNNFLLISELQHSKNDESEEIKNIVHNLSNRLFIPVLLEYLWMDFNGMTEVLLNSKYYIILRQIELVSKNDISNNENRLYLKQNNGKIKYNGVLIDGVLASGTDEWHFNNGDLLYSLKYENFKIVEGKFFNKINKERNLVFDCTFTNEYAYKDGYVTYFYTENKIKYKGLIENGKYNGKGNLYCEDRLSTLEFSGVWDNGKRKEGEYRNKSENASIKYFTGEFKNNRPYSGKIECSTSHELTSGIYGFKGLIKEGKPMHGSGYVFSKNVLSKEFLYNHPEYDNNYNNYYEDYYEDCHEDVPEDILQEESENRERDEREMDFNELKSQYGHVVELIRADWESGNQKIAEDDILNREYFAYINSKIKK